MTSNNRTTSAKEIPTSIFFDATLHKRVFFLSGLEYISKYESSSKFVYLYKLLTVSCKLSTDSKGRIL
jgi:hypothetical protein